MFQTFLLSLLLVFGLCMAGLTLVFLMSWDINLNVEAGGPANVHFILPRCPGSTTPCLPGSCSPRSFFSSDDSSRPGRSEAGTRSVDAADRIYVVVLLCRG